MVSRRRQGGSGVAGVVLQVVVFLSMAALSGASAVDPLPPASQQVCGAAGLVSPSPDAAGRRIRPELAKVMAFLHQIEDGDGDVRWRFFGAEFCRLSVRQGTPSVPGL